jgi:nucleoside-diphosphate-sugar epimerase
MRISTKSKYLVTGGAGFIGSHLVSRLLHENAKVTVLDLAPPGSGSFLSLLGLEEFVDYRVGDIRHRQDLEFIRRGAFDVVFHLAAQPISLLSNLDTASTMAINVGGTRNVCAALQEAGGSLVLASSACVYGRPDEGSSPLREADPFRAGVYRYSESKQQAEAIVKESKGFDAVIGRFVNVYGPGDRHFSRIVPRTIRQLLKGEPPCLSRGNGDTVLDFLHVDDAVEGLLALSAHVGSPRSSTPRDNVFNFGIGSGHALTIRDLVRKISLCFDRPSREPKVPERPSEPAMVKYLDPTRALHVLGWSPQTRLEHGLPPVVAWYKENLAKIDPLEDESIQGRLQEVAVGSA